VIATTCHLLLLLLLLLLTAGCGGGGGGGVQGIVKQFFNEKEVTSTLVMDALYSGCRQIEEFTRLWQQVRRRPSAAPLAPHPSPCRGDCLRGAQQ
jgi:hypothetical protein